MIDSFQVDRYPLDEDQAYFGHRGDWGPLIMAWSMAHGAAALRDHPHLKNPSPCMQGVGSDHTESGTLGVWRNPLYDQTRYMAYSSLTLGAWGVFHWIRRFGRPETPAINENVGRLYHELRTLIPPSNRAPCHVLRRRQHLDDPEAARRGMLTRYHHQNVAAGLMRKTTYPSPDFMIRNGHSTLPEYYEAIRNHNMPIVAIYVEWMLTDVLGIRPDLQKPGYRNIILSPMRLDEQAWVRGRLQTQMGMIQVRWERRPAQILLRAQIPLRSTAQLTSLSLSCTRTHWCQRWRSSVGRTGTPFRKAQLGRVVDSELLRCLRCCHTLPTGAVVLDHVTILGSLPGQPRRRRPTP